MKFSTVIFDMDGLLIDSEPFWKEAGNEALLQHGITLSPEQYNLTMGLRTPEWIDYWFTNYTIDKMHATDAISWVEQAALDKIKAQGVAMAGVEYIMEFCKAKNYTLGLASSSPMRLIQLVVDKLQIRHYLDAITSAEELPYGKPHPQVFLNCAEELSVHPGACIVFEDSFNGMIAAKAARMKCVVIPEAEQFDQPRWGAADAKLTSLEMFNDQILEQLTTQ
jgi:HAD superfamily hydrolase (TIGR01509 family)